MKWELVKREFKRKGKLTSIVNIYSYNYSKLGGTIRVKIGVTIVNVHNIYYESKSYKLKFLRN